MAETYTQRMRLLFAQDDSVKWVGHLDMARTWERAIRRARLPLAYTQGFNAQPRLQFAAALPVGFVSGAEVVDIYLDDALDPSQLIALLQPALPPGIRLLQAAAVARELRSLQSLLEQARYRVEVYAPAMEHDVRARLVAFMAATHVMRRRRRGPAMTEYDLRPLVLSAEYLGEASGWHHAVIAMQCRPGATGRPDELLAELGLGDLPCRVQRLELIFATSSAGGETTPAAGGQEGIVSA